jgi:hypothetical protein
MRFERLHQALETVLLVERLQCIDLLRPDRDALERRQPHHMRSQITVGADGHEPATLRQPVERLAQVLAGLALDLGRMRDQFVERAVLQQPLGGCLGADLVDARHVVDRVADQRLVIHHQRRRHAELRRHASHVALLAVHRVDDGDVRVDQLTQVLVAA